MELKTLCCVFISLLFICGGILRAALPEDAIVLEPETMKITGDGWVVKENFAGWFKGACTGNKCLYGAGKGEGKASAILECQRSGKYHIWVRYLDLEKAARKEKFNTFIITAYQENAKDATGNANSGDSMESLLNNVREENKDTLKNRKEFDQFGLRLDQAGEAKWGDSYAAFVWDFMEADLNKGKFELLIEKSHPDKTGPYQRTLDCIIITSDLKYEALDSDFYPLYVKFVPDPKTPGP
ncbi:MAG: hypothetical protein A2X49_04820 [Lentisphaerae bacterium GWF2_52_8]|nr:MAG: hypothetical protein A2X49_04820 [Lentisphaerae bacterium GWF2_52_8]